ncbi:T9SS type A sorting domain-containing protein [Tenacibaculum sp. MEBiC06402]|uniref:T9SS type A sorting domain-containing protein n=1 Tax=unclassified Tenacibaculum TaxID=2635139 RepID=UPI003B9CD959
MKKALLFFAISILTMNVIMAQDCGISPINFTDYVISGNFSQDNSGDDVINDVVMLGNSHTTGAFRLNTLSSDLNGNKSLKVGDNMINYDLANVNGRMVRGDFDNDGHIDDFILINKTGVSSMRFDLFKSNGASTPIFSQSSVYSLNGYDPDKITGRVVSGDFDNDGYWDDIAALYDYGNGETRIHTFRSNGNTFVYSSSVGWWNSIGYTASKVTDRVISGDFDKDGHVDDIAAFYDYGNGQFRIHVWLSTGTNFWYQGSNGWFQSSPYAINNVDRISKRVISLNIDRKGENYDDIVAFYKRPINNGVTRMQIWKSDGNSFFKVAVINHSSNWELSLNPDLITGRIVDYDSRTSGLTQGKPSDIIAFHKMLGLQYLFFKSKKTINKYESKIEHSRPFYCESKSNGDDVVIEELISTYPNPTISTTTLEIDESLIDSTNEVQVHDVYGRLVFSTNRIASKISIDLSKELPGVYLVKLIERETTHTLKIIKE